MVVVCLTMLVLMFNLEHLSNVAYSMDSSTKKKENTTTTFSTLVGDWRSRRRSHRRLDRRKGARQANTPGLFTFAHNNAERQLAETNVRCKKTRILLA